MIGGSMMNETIFISLPHSAQVSGLAGRDDLVDAANHRCPKPSESASFDCTWKDFR